MIQAQQKQIIRLKAILDSGEEQDDERLNYGIFLMESQRKRLTRDISKQKKEVRLLEKDILTSIDKN